MPALVSSARRRAQSRPGGSRPATRIGIECVPNFSEGRSTATLEELGDAIQSAGSALLDVHADPDHNRSVFTCAGSAAELELGVARAAAWAMEKIDLRAHRGAHPRIGATDVIPVVPLARDSAPACLRLARRLAEALWQDLGIPVYFYGSAAKSAERTRLEAVRKIGFERLRELARAGRVRPDVGGPELHPSAGACCVGVREPMVAFNVLIDDRNALAASAIAKAVRQSSGGLEGVKALGLYMKSAGVAQVSMNITRLDRANVADAYDAVCAEAAERGVAVLGSELVGLAPRAALGAHPERLRIRGFHSGMLLENRLRTC